MTVVRREKECLGEEQGMLKGLEMLVIKTRMHLCL